MSPDCGAEDVDWWGHVSIGVTLELRSLIDLCILVVILVCEACLELCV